MSKAKKSAVRESTALARWKAAREKKIEEAERDREANRIHDLWKELWTDHVVEPLRALAPRWVLAWDELGKVSISGDRQKTAEAMLKIATLANEIGTVWPSYAAAYVKWYREHGTAWNARVSRDRGHFLDRPIPLPRPPDVDPLRWEWAYPVWAINPVAMMERFAENVTIASGYESIRRLDVVDDLALQVAILIGLAKNDLSKEDAAKFVTFATPNAVVSSGLALAAAALDAPEVVDRLHNAIQSDALGMAKWVLKSIGPDEYKRTILVALAAVDELAARTTYPRGECSPKIPASDVMPLHEEQAEILEMLRGTAMSQKQLASGIDVNRQQMSRDYLKPLMALGLVKHSRVAGYYRPDDPPPDWNAALQ